MFLDLHNLEVYKEEQIFDLTFFILGTDHKHYVNKDQYSSQTQSFDFRHGKKYKSKTKLIYNTQTPYGDPITLNNDYTFTWDIVKKQFDVDETREDIYFLKLKNK